MEQLKVVILLFQISHLFLWGQNKAASLMREKMIRILVREIGVPERNRPVGMISKYLYVIPDICDKQFLERESKEQK